MTPKDAQKLKHHLTEAARILRQNTPEANLQDFESIELAARNHMVKTVGSTIGEFFLKRRAEAKANAASDHLYRTGQGGK